MSTFEVFGTLVVELEVDEVAVEEELRVVERAPLETLEDREVVMLT